MTIRISALKGMIRAEMAADDWFAKMSPKEQEAYKRAHPRSKFAKMGGPAAKPVKAAPSSGGGGTIKMDDMRPDITRRFAKKVGAVHERHASEGGGGGYVPMSSIKWNANNAKAVHDHVVKNFSSDPDDPNWADDDAHHEIEGWKKLRDHVKKHHPV